MSHRICHRKEELACAAVGGLNVRPLRYLDLNYRLEALDTKEHYFLDLAAEEGWPKDKLRVKIDAIRSERKSIKHSLDQAEHQLDAGRQVFYRALELLDN